MYSKLAWWSRILFLSLLQVLSRSGSSEVQRRFGDMLGLEITPELDGLSGSNRDCVKLRGIPYNATAEDVIVFFGDLKEDIAMQGVHMVLNAMVRGHAWRRGHEWRNGHAWRRGRGEREK